MKTFNDFEIEVMRIREAINNMIVKGEHNASLVVYSVGKCNDIINALHEIAQQKAEEVNENGEQDSGTSE